MGVGTVEGASSAMVELGLRLRALRAKAGVTRKQLAQMSDTSERYLAHLETGDGNPSLSVLTAVASALDIVVPELLPFGGERSHAQEQAAAAMRRLPPERLAAFTDWLETPAGSGGEKSRRVVLVGLRGAGKTALGKALAERMDTTFIEMSKEVEQLYGGNIGLLIELSGQAALRRYEREAWDHLCRTHESAVIAASGGVVADGPLYERLLSSAHSIWLEASPDDHMARVMAQGDLRPMGSNRSAMTDLKAILAARTADYARADARLDTSAQSETETVEKLATLARRLLK
jgi:XRE family aerobic/anaerobic benzoate catabolism transcriptional regulator